MRPGSSARGWPPRRYRKPPRHKTGMTFGKIEMSAIFTENQTKQDLTHAGDKLTKHIYDYVVTDSKVERSLSESWPVLNAHTSSLLYQSAGSAWWESLTTTI